ncbi:MAG: hypothetical protein NC299_05680 [Lachnospiraceae bacterium]|nr:hypothetical protein [Ruminococcus sp.]MCM1274841.1 hypothetical protein [Lachnospiraceae bacterium]
MKDIKSFNAPKYGSEEYSPVGEGVYKNGDDYVASLSFVQEPEFGEGANAAEISQYPLEDILDKFMCYVSDFYEELNTANSQTCYLEFSGSAEDLRELCAALIGKHAYNKSDGQRVKLCIE